MEQRKRLGLGTFPFAGVFHPIGEAEILSVVRSFLDLEGFYIDTAPTYGSGYVETLLGRMLRNVPRDSYYIATKCGYVSRACGQFQISGRYQDIVDECHKSLRRLQLDFVDQYTLHAPDPSTPCEETLAALTDLQQQGKIKDIGISNVTLPQLEQYNRMGNIAFVQNRYSLLNRSLSHSFIAYCERRKVGIIPYQVIERGLLTDKAVTGIKISVVDLRRTKPEFSSKARQIIANWVREHLAPLASDLGMPIAALAIWWALEQPGVAYSICGATNEAQLLQNFMALDLRDSDSLLERIDMSFEILNREVSSIFPLTEPITTSQGRHLCWGVDLDPASSRH